MGQKKHRNATKVYSSLTERFRSSYKELSYNQRKEARKVFCEKFGIVDSTLRQKINGAFSVMENEVSWMEKFAEKMAELTPDSV